MGTLIARFEGHEGPVRAIDFHPSQPIFVSGGDDYTIKVWSLNTMKCMFTLTGHLDYVRTVFFHPTLPWIISASDDQTIRIWNWQSRKEIACLTGHNHYVMCAQFHPTKDLVVSASLDQTVRVWDISGLRKKQSASQGALNMSAAGMGPGFDSMQQPGPQQDVFGNTDAVVKYVLEGHDKGVNWAAFHPTLPLIVSAGDDRVVKIWRMSETRAWEVDSCRGHTNNVLCALFHPTEDLILSVGEDKTIRTWDLNTRTPVKQFKRENDRFWMIAAHPNMNLFAACHDSGVMVFKLDRERPASTMFQNTLLFVNNEYQLQKYSYQKQQASMPLLSLKKLAVPWNKIRTISYNPAENAILIQSGENEAGVYALVSVPKEAVGALDAAPKGRGKATAACFIARNRYVTFSKVTHRLEVRDMNDNVTKTIVLDDAVKDVIYLSPGVLLLVMSTKVVAYDVQQKRKLSEIQVNNAKYVSSSPDGKYIALLSKHTITVATRKLKTVMSMHETIRVKSASWDDTGVLIYSTLNHLKYALLNGDIGTIKTLKNAVYVTRVLGNKCFCLNRKGAVECIEIDPTEYKFKKALVNKRYRDVLSLIKNSNLVGENIIGYLEKRGYPEVALQFVQDPETRFELATECHNLDIALEQAQKLDKPAIWAKLGKEALTQGRVSVVELAYQRLHQMDKLSLFYLVTGNLDKLSKMEQIAEARGDLSSLLQNSIYLGSVEKRIQVLLHAGLSPLAYALAKNNGLDDIAQQIISDAGRDTKPLESEIPTNNGPVDVLQPKLETTGDYPLKGASLSFFEKAIAGKLDDLSLEDEAEENVNVEEVDGGGADGDLFDDSMGQEVDVDQADAWDMDDDQLDVSLNEDKEDEGETVTETSGLPEELGAWVRNSKCAAGYIAAGAFDGAARLLNKQVGITNFEPLRERFMQIYQSSKLSFSAVDGFPSLRAYIRSTAEDSDKATPYVPGLEHLEPLLHQGFKLFRANKLDKAVDVFRQLLYIVTTLVVYNEEDEQKCRETLEVCREYILGLSIELKRRSLPASEVKRNLELAILFTRTKLQPAHRVNALQVAMTQCFKHKNFTMASYFAGEFLKIVKSGTRAEHAKKIIVKADTISTDAVEIDFDPYAEFDICAGTYTPIYKNTPFVIDPLTGAKYHMSEKDKLSDLTKISKIGAPASGLRILA